MSIVCSLQTLDLNWAAPAYSCACFCLSSLSFYAVSSIIRCSTLYWKPKSSIVILSIIFTCFSNSRFRFLTRPPLGGFYPKVYRFWRVLLVAAPLFDISMLSSDAFS